MPQPFSDPKYDLDDLSHYVPAVLATTQAVSRRENGKPFNPEQISPAEVQLATWLTKRGITDYVQQSPIGLYAADFHWPHLGLVVEIDGKQHDRLLDDKRDAYLLANGVHRVLHITVKALYADPEHALGHIAAWRERRTAEIAAT